MFSTKTDTSKPFASINKTGSMVTVHNQDNPEAKLLPLAAFVSASIGNFRVKQSCRGHCSSYIWLHFWLQLRVIA
jgi:hypothetical protein